MINMFMIENAKDSDPDFFWKHIEIENYDNILSQMQNAMAPVLLATPERGFFHYDKDKFKEECPLFMDWATNNSLEIRVIAIIKTLATHPQDIHRDFIPAAPGNTYALNLNIHNCVETYTRMFKLKDDIELPPVSYGPNGKPFFSYSEENCVEVSRYTLEKPVILNVAQIHQVVNKTDKTRISVSFRFKNLLDLDRF